MSSATSLLLLQNSVPVLMSGGAVPWYLAGGIPAAQCYAAYVPFGAASEAAAKINIAIPGTYNLANGSAYPAWAAATGWTFTRTSSQYLLSTTAPKMTNNFSLLVIGGFGTDGTSTTVFGTRSSASTGLVCKTEQYNNTGKVGISALGVGDVAFTQNTPASGYIWYDVLAPGTSAINVNGTANTQTVGSPTAPNLDGWVVGGVYVGGSFTDYFSGVLRAVAVYSPILTAGQKAAVLARAASIIAG